MQSKENMKCHGNFIFQGIYNLKVGIGNTTFTLIYQTVTCNRMHRLKC